MNAKSMSEMRTALMAWKMVQRHHKLQNYRIGMKVGALLCGLILLSGCTKALLMSNASAQEKVKVSSPNTREYRIVIADSTVYSIPDDGQVIIEIPRLPSGCATYAFGVRVANTSSYDVPTIRLEKGGSIVRRLSLNELAKLPMDGEGYHILKVK